mmetsp:Transcript_23758/g.56657  ORF Transcript_23758/g.56657 Transcript_23758/m.56657 type:complete len:231 (-) Transcript_23758:49-741(-)
MVISAQRGKRSRGRAAHVVIAAGGAARDRGREPRHALPRPLRSSLQRMPSGSAGRTPCPRGVVCSCGALPDARWDRYSRSLVHRRDGCSRGPPALPPSERPGHHSASRLRGHLPHPPHPSRHRHHHRGWCLHELCLLDLYRPPRYRHHHRFRCLRGMLLAQAAHPPRRPHHSRQKCLRSFHSLGASLEHAPSIVRFHVALGPAARGRAVPVKEWIHCFDPNIPSRLFSLS